MVSEVLGRMGLAVGAGENAREVLEQVMKVGGLVLVNEGRARGAEAFGEGVEIQPEGRTPFRGSLDKERCRLDGALSTTVTGHLVSVRIVWEGFFSTVAVEIPRSSIG